MLCARPFIVSCFPTGFQHVTCSEFPGELEKIRVWFRDYKIPDGKPANAFGFDDKCMNREFALEVIEETAGFYQNLKAGVRQNTEELSLV